MITIQQVNSAIISGEFTNDQLTSIIDAVRFARAQLTKQNRRALRVGDNVKFTVRRSGIIETGNVTKIMVKNALVKTQFSTWKVPVSMLEVV